MDIDAQTLRAIRQFLSLIRPHYDVAGAILYGSYARGTQHTDSDVDVAVLLKGPRGNAYQAARNMVRQAYTVLLDTGVDISPLPIWVEEWEHPEITSNPALLRNIAEEGLRL